MARIRALKPEFWSSPNLPGDPWARLLYMAMWNWADDKGVGTANVRELLGFAFPNDDNITPGEIRRMFEELHRAFGVDFYEVSGRPYYAIPNWDKHQKFDNRSKGKHPGPELAERRLYQEFSKTPADSAGVTSSARRDAVAGTGEQSNRGTGEQGNSTSSEVAVATTRPDVGELLDLLDEELSKNGVTKLPARNRQNLDAMRLLLDRDGRTADEVAAAIRWCQADAFWWKNIMSATKLREKFERLKADSKDATRAKKEPSIFTPNQERGLAIINEYREEESRRGEITDG